MYATAITLGVLGIAAAVTAIVLSLRPIGHRDPATGEARSILDLRLANGEIDATEHRERVAVLERHEEPSSRRSPLAIIAGIAAIVLPIAMLVVLMTPTGPGGWWGLRDGRGHMGGPMHGMMGGGSTAERQAPDPVEDGVNLVVEADDMHFSPDEIEITAGEAVNLSLDNQGAVFHDLDVDGADFRLAADPGTTDTGALTIDEPGTYPFICTVRGHAAAGMEGTITVVAS
jgi:plastocyanin